MNDFNPGEHLINIKNRQGSSEYLPVQWRLVWFRNECPEGSIETEIVHLDLEKETEEEVFAWNAEKRRNESVIKTARGIAIFRATVKDGKGGIATGTGSERAASFGDFIEKAECVPLQSEILTRFGFKRYDELKVGEEVLAYDLERDQCVWTPLRLVTVHESLPMAKLGSARWDVLCTPDHSWASTHTNRFQMLAGPQVTRHRELLKAQELKVDDNIILAAPGPDEEHPLTPRDAALLGWIVTDRTIQKRGNGYIRGAICQSKEQNFARIRELVGSSGAECVSKPITRTFPSTGRTYETLPQHWWYLTAAETRRVFDTAGFQCYADLPGIVCRLSRQARSAMLEAMMLAEADQKGNFAQGKREVLEAWQILATLEGYALEVPYQASVGNVTVQRLKKRRSLCASELTLEPVEPMAAWCPTTDYGTWVMRQDGKVMITGNTKAIGRALAGLGYGTQFAPELNEEHRIVDAPVDFQPTSGNKKEEGSGSGRVPATAQNGQGRSTPNGRQNGPGSQTPVAPIDEATAPITERQSSSIRKLCEALGKTEPEQMSALSYLNAKKLIQQLTTEYRQAHNRAS